MKKTKISILILSLAMAACQKPEIVQLGAESFTASIESLESQTKTSMTPEKYIVWSQNDRLAVFQGSKVSTEYKLADECAGTSDGRFIMVNSDANSNVGSAFQSNIAFYPYLDNLSLTVSEGPYYGINGYTLPSEQMFTEGSFANGSFPMIAVTETLSNHSFKFKNVLGAIKLQLKGNQTVKSIKITGKNNEVLSGTATVTTYPGETKPSITMTGTDAASKSVTLSCGAKGVLLNESTATEFIIALPPVVFTKGFTVTVTNSADKELTVETDKENKVLRSSLLVMPEVTLDDPTVDLPEGEYVNLSEKGTANSYIVSQKGAYKFSTVKGSSNESIGVVSSADILWETFGTDVTPNVGDLVKNASYSDGYITFQTADTFNEGNAVIAAKDASGNILWSWHIWLTDEPEEHEYCNNAGTMMDRNLGATSATPGDVGALGLLYQWGRKDPFLGSSSISSDNIAKSTITWPSIVSSDSSNGTIEYATAHPTAFISHNGDNWDWYYTGDSSTDNTRWTTSDKIKAIYDPCPHGWRVPDGETNGIWSNAGFDDTTYDSANKGISFSISSPSTTWYPASGFFNYFAGSLGDVGRFGHYWSASTNGIYACYMSLGEGGHVMPATIIHRTYGFSVRCVRDSTPSTPAEPETMNLSLSGTANSYIVSKQGKYMFSAVKGNSSESVGVVASAEVLWESYGTNVTPNVGTLVKNVSYKNGEVTFQTAYTFKKGNAVIAAKDASGNILWSWHIWFTDQPQEHVYNNNAGIMMDRNLGATSATLGEVAAFGLLYQWGRKDPFLGSSSIGIDMAHSTINWPSTVVSDSSNGTIEYATAHPTTFISYNSSNYDWYYTGSSYTDDTRWTTSETSKSIYDPCPVGWRVPDGGENGVWSNARFDDTTYDSVNKGISFSISSPSTTWYPASGWLNCNDGSLEWVGYFGFYWSTSPSSKNAYCMYFGSDVVNLSCICSRAYGYSVRCVRDSTPSTPAEPETTNLSL